MKFLTLPTFAHYIRGAGAASNAGVVTLTAAGITAAATLQLSVQPGDLVLAHGQIRFVKGVTAGSTLIRLDDGVPGTAVQWLNASSTMDIRDAQMPANQDHQWSLMGIGKGISVAAPTFRIGGQSAGSDASVAVGSARLTVIVFKGGGSGLW